jgi:hypothetical protein
MRFDGFSQFRMKMDYTKLPATWSRMIIDGDPGAGKTTLAKEIARECNAKLVSFDEYLSGNRENYLQQLDYQKLRNDIMAGEGKVVMEGVCALMVLTKIEVRYDVHIFIKRMNGFIGWDFEHYLNPKVKLPKSKLDAEVVGYYRKLKPFHICDFEMSRDILDNLT